MSYSFAHWPLGRTSTEAPHGGSPMENPGKMPSFATAQAMVKELRPEIPVHCIRPHALQERARWFLANFPGDVLYAVKCNPDGAVIRNLHSVGVKHYDVASVAEMRAVAEHAPGARMYFMHPVKSREAIRKAYFEFGIRDFAIDSEDGLQKMIEETGSAQDLRIHVRLALPNRSAAHDLSRKFGASPPYAVKLLQNANQVAQRVGLCFHVGSQCMDPESFKHALKLAGEVIARSGVELDYLDVGGGFPAAYPGLSPQPLGAYMNAIREGVSALRLPSHCQLWCEPGRAMVADAGSLVVRVEARKDKALYINDGLYGSLFDAGVVKTRYPARLIRHNGSDHKTRMEGFILYGPTCDSLDVMPGPFVLPHDVTEGDWIELGQLGAYCNTMRSGFNGFDQCLNVELWDSPQLQTPEFMPRTDRRTLNGDSVSRLNFLASLRDAYEVEMS